MGKFICVLCGESYDTNESVSLEGLEKEDPPYSVLRLVAASPACSVCMTRAMAAIEALYRARRFMGSCDTITF